MCFDPCSWIKGYWALRELVIRFSSFVQSCVQKNRKIGTCLLNGSARTCLKDASRCGDLLVGGPC